MLRNYYLRTRYEHTTNIQRTRRLHATTNAIISLPVSLKNIVRSRNNGIPDVRVDLIDCLLDSLGFIS